IEVPAAIIDTLPPPPMVEVPSSNTTKITVRLSVKSGWMNAFNHRSPTDVEQSCMSWHRLGTTNENAGRCSGLKSVSGCTYPSWPGKYRNGTCFFANRGDVGKPSAYALQEMPACDSCEPIVGPRCTQSVQSFVTPWVEPETSAR